MEMQEWVPFALVWSYKIYRIVKKIKPLKLPSDVVDFLVIFNQIRSFQTCFLYRALQYNYVMLNNKINFLN
jgi:hypothetical protein